MIVSAPVSDPAPTGDPAAQADTGAVHIDQATLLSLIGELDASGIALLRDALAPIVASGHRLVADVSRVEFFGSAYLGALLGTFAVARRIPAVGAVIEALRRPDTADDADVTVLPLVAREKLNC